MRTPLRHAFSVTYSIVFGSLLLGGCLQLAGCKTSPGAKRAEDYSSVAEMKHPTATKPSTQGATSVDMPDARPVIVCFGDSITAGYGLDAGESYPDFLQKDLDANGYHYRVANYGVSGNTTKDALDRVDSVVALKPAVVLLEIGGNDGLRGVPITQTRANFDAILAKLKDSGTKTLLLGITLPRQYGATYISQFDETYTLMAKKYNVPLYPFIYKDVYGTAGMIQEDHIHPTARGSEVIARNVMPVVTPLLKK